jgi:hypothetical protein
MVEVGAGVMPFEFVDVLDELQLSIIAVTAAMIIIFIGNSFIKISSIILPFSDNKPRNFYSSLQW